MTEEKQAVRRVEVVGPDESWEAMFELEKDRLRNLFGDLVIEVYHIGSTAIPNIYAKPIIDILIEVKDIEKVDKFNSGMKQLGYIPKGEYGIPGRRFFIKGTEVDRTHHIHIFQQGDVEVGKHVNFRDYMRLHPDKAMAYSKLKRELAKKYPEDITGYMAEKNDFIKKIEAEIIIWKKNIEKDLF